MGWGGVEVGSVVAWGVGGGGGGGGGSRGEVLGEAGTFSSLSLFSCSSLFCLRPVSLIHSFTH